MGYILNTNASAEYPNLSELLTGLAERYKLTLPSGAEHLFSTEEELNAFAATLTEAPPEEAPSPTGREPKLIWTKKQQFIWQKMKAEYDAGLTTLAAQWYNYIRTEALSDPYGDTGIWPTLMYQITGDTAWAEKAWVDLTRTFLAKTSFLDDDDLRQYSSLRVLMYDWLFPYLTEERKAQYRAQIDKMWLGKGINQTPQVPGYAVSGTRTNDSDQAVGVYFGVVWYWLVCGDHHEPANDLFELPIVGGLDSTGRDRTTLRNAITDFVMSAAGGEWPESGEYNMNTMMLVKRGYAGVKTATGVDHYPEITAWLPFAANRATYMLTPDFVDPVQWGDDQKPRSVDLIKWVTHAMTFETPISRDLVHEFVARFGAVGYGTSEPHPEGFFFFDPWGARVSRTTLPKTFWSEGQGILTTRTSWDDNASLFFAHAPQRTMLGYYDHAVNYGLDIQLYRAGGWGLTHPISYGGNPNSGVGTNGMLHSGYGAPIEFRGATTHASGEGYCYIAGTVGGQLLPNNANYYQIPPYFYEWTRSVIWLPSSDGSLDTLIVCDRSHSVDPQTLPKYANYGTAYKTRIAGAPSLKQWLLHMPVVPTINGTNIEWPGAKLSTVWPATTVDVVDQKATWTDYTIASERKYNIRLKPVTVKPFDTFTNVIFMGSLAGTSCERVSGADWEGVLVHRPNQPDVLAIFNAAPGPVLNGHIAANTYDPATQTVLNSVRLRSSGYTVSW